MNNMLHAVRGMNDIMPPESELWEYLEGVLRPWLQSYGYRYIRTPILEQTALFRRAIGNATDIVEKEMYSFADALNGEHLSLRPEATASTVRMAIEHNILHSGTQRLYYLGPMFRHERPQKGRYRQFHQVGVETLGFFGPDIDAELLLMCQRLWDKLGLAGIRLELNSLGNTLERKAHRQALVEYFEKNKSSLDQDSLRRLIGNPLRILDSKNPDMQALVSEAPKLIEYLGEESHRHFEGVQSILRNSGVSYQINPRLVRGLYYYNLTVFEWVTDKPGAQGTVCGGGRYDGLFEQLGGKPTPACGWAMGIERLLTLVEEAGMSPQNTKPDVYLVSQGEQARHHAFLVAEKIRDKGYIVVQHCGGGSFKSQMKKADTSGASLAVIVGEEEVAAGEVTIKTLRTEVTQFRVPLEALGGFVAKQLHDNQH